MENTINDTVKSFCVHTKHCCEKTMPEELKQEPSEDKTIFLDALK
jgi:hypothetical protein